MFIKNWQLISFYIDLIYLGSWGRAFDNRIRTGGGKLANENSTRYPFDYFFQMPVGLSRDLQFAQGGGVRSCN